MVYILAWKLSGVKAVIYDMPVGVNTTLMTKRIWANRRFSVALHCWFDNSHYYQIIPLSCMWMPHKVLNTDHIIWDVFFLFFSFIFSSELSYVFLFYKLLHFKELLWSMYINIHFPTATVLLLALYTFMCLYYAIT